MMQAFAALKVLWFRQRYRQAALLDESWLTSPAPAPMASCIVQDVERQCFHLAGSQSVTVTFHPQARSLFRCFAALSKGGPARMVVQVAGEDGVVGARASVEIREQGRWQNLDLDLGTFRGRKVRVTMSVELAQDGELLLGDLSLYRSVSWRVMRERFWRKVRVGGWLELRRLFTYRFHAGQVGSPRGRVGARTTAVPPLRWGVVVYGDSSSASVQTSLQSLESQTAVTWRAVLAGDAAGAPSDPRIRVLPPEARGGLRAALEACEADYVAFLRAPDRIAPDGLRRFEEAIASANTPDFAYGDEVDETGPEGSSVRIFKPDWAPEHFRSCMYTGRLTVVRRTAALAAGPLDPNHGDAQLYDLLLRMTERGACGAHVPEVVVVRRAESATAGDLAKRALQDHLDREGKGSQAEAGLSPGVFRVRHRLRGTPRVSIVLPTASKVAQALRGPLDLVTNCVRSIHNLSTYGNYELLVGHNGTISPPAAALLDRPPHRLMQYQASGPFNLAHKMNVIAAHATGEYLLLLNDDTEVIAPGWMEAMLEFAQQEDVGLVGARLLYGDRRIQHSGTVFGMATICGLVYNGHPANCEGYRSSTRMIRNYSSVTGACVMIRKSLFDRLGGLDEQFPFLFDVSICLEVLKLGKRVVYTPYAELFHHESATITSHGAGFLREVLQFRRRWNSWMIRPDPLYVPDRSWHGSACRPGGWDG